MSSNSIGLALIYGILVCSTIELRGEDAPKQNVRVIRAQKTLRNHAAFVRSVAFSSDGRLLASGDDEGKVVLWDTSTGKKVGAIEEKGFVSSLNFSPDAKKLAIAADHTVILQTENLARRRQLSGPGVFELKFSPDGRFLAGSSGVEAFIWNLSSNEQRKSLKLASGKLTPCNSGLSLAIDPKSTLLAIGCDGDIVKFWNIKTGRFLREVHLHSYDSVSGVNGLDFTPNGRILAAGLQRADIKLLAAPDWTVQKTVNLSGSVKDVSFSPDGRFLAAAIAIQPIVWDVSNSRMVCKLEGHKSFVYEISFSADGKTLATASADRTVKLWDVSFLAKDK